jgi:hypothetical protein
MTEHTHEYCMDWMCTEGKCCPDGLHRTDCKVIEGYHKHREENRDPDRPWSFGDAIATCVVVSLVSFAVLWRVLG